MEFIDTPGLHASTSCAQENRTALRNIQSVIKKHKPGYTFWVDRCAAEEWSTYFLICSAITKYLSQVPMLGCPMLS
jgi:hypothetical protein